MGTRNASEVLDSLYDPVKGLMPAGIKGGASGQIAEVGVAAAQALHVQTKPIPHGALGHYRVNHRCAIVNNQAANSRLFEFRNNHASNLLIPTRLLIKWIQTGAHTAAIEDSLDVFKVTGFTVLDTTNTVTPTVSIKRAGMAAAPGSADVRGVTVAGNSAGMTGGNLTKDGGSIGQLPQWLLATLPTASTVALLLSDLFDDVNGTHPFVFAQNEGFIIENRVLLGAAAASSVYIDLSWAEVTAY
jgi:hypothetical protein